MKSFSILLGLFFAVNIYSQPIMEAYLFGGNDNEYSYEHCFDADGNFIIVGVVRGADMYFTDTIGTLDTEYKNIFIRKYSPDLSTLISSTIICGTGHDYCKSVDIDSHGNVFIGGFVLSSSVPVTPNAYQTTNNSPSGYEAYIIKLNSGLDSLLSATYFGGEEKDYIYKLRIDHDDNVVVVGSTQSANYIATTGAYDETYNGTTGSLFNFGDGYVAKFDNNLENKLSATYLGAGGDDACYSLIINNDNNIVITGTTTSTDYPVSPNALSTSFNGDMDIVVTELTSSLDTIVNSTYIGGNGRDIGWDIAYNSSENSYIIGSECLSSNLNISGNVADPTPGGNGDGLIVILNGNMEGVHSATYVGGNDQDLVTCINYDGNTIVYGGMTESTDLPTSNDAYYPNYIDENEMADGFVGSINYDLSTFDYLTYFGGNDDDFIWDVSSNNNKMYLSGTTYSDNIESDSVFQGETDAVIAYFENIYLSNKQTASVSLSDNLHVYPNPAKDVLYINFNQDEINSIVEIVNISGNTVKKFKPESTKITIDISTFPKGLYILKTEKTSTRFVVE